MAITYENTYQEYTATTSQAIFPFTELSFITGQSNTLKVYKDGVLVDSADYVIVEGVATNRVVSGGTLTFGVALAGGELVRIVRDTPVTQPLTLSDKDVQQVVDRLTMQVAEAANTNSQPAPVTGIGLVYPWNVGILFYVNQVAKYDGRLYQCLTQHTSIDFVSDLVMGRWVELRVAGPKGDVGAQGVAGDKGDKGDVGATGAAGADGIFAAVASQAEAEIGTDNVAGMTALRTKQAIEAQVAGTAAIVALQAEVDAVEVTAAGNTAVLAAQDLRIDALEGKMSSAILNASDTITNNAVGVALTYEDPANPPVRLPLVVDADAAKAYVIEFSMERGDYTLHTTASGWIYLNYRGVDWEISYEYIGWHPQVTFAVLTDGLTKTGSVIYSSSNLAGANYYGNMKYSLREMGKGVL